MPIPLKMQSLMLSGTCLTKVETLSQVRKEIPWHALLPSYYHCVAPTFSCSYSCSSLFWDTFLFWIFLCLCVTTFLPSFAHIIFSSLRFSRTGFKLYLGELFQAWIWLTGGVTQDWDPHHRWEVSGWCRTTSWKTAKCWHWAVCYW